MLKKHGNLEQTVEDYAENIRQLGKRSRALIEEQHPDRCVTTFASWASGAARSSRSSIPTGA